MEKSRVAVNDAPAIGPTGELVWADGERIGGVRLCAACGGLHGQLVLDRQGDRSRSVLQECGCVPPDKREWAYELTELGVYVELCRCCAFEPIRARSRWASFYCDTCRAGVLAANEAFGGFVIPIGRHSMMHGEWLSLHEAGSTEHAETFVRRTLGLRGRIEQLTEWRVQQLAEHLEELDITERDLPIAAFLEAARDHQLDKATVLRGLVRRFAEIGGRATDRR